MFPALHHQFLPGLLTQAAQHIELLVESLGSAADSGFGQLLQPLGAMLRCVNELAGTGNAPAPLQGLEAIHHLADIFSDRQITARQFLQDPYAVLSMVDR